LIFGRADGGHASAAENPGGDERRFQDCRADLKLRGPGELLGQEQSGAMRLRFGDLTEDLNLIRQARELWRKVFRVAK